MSMKKQDLLKGEKEEILYGVIQAMYGNRTGITFSEDMVDGLIWGYTDGSLSRFWDKEKEKPDRSMIPIPGEEGLVLIYNKYLEKRELEETIPFYEKEGYVSKPLAEIPELDVKIYSRCLACRVGADGRLKSLERDDYGKVMKYLAM